MSPLYYLASLALAVTLLVSANVASEGERALSELETPEEKTDTLFKRWMEGLSFGLYKGASEKARQRARLEAVAGYHRGRVNLCSLGLFALAAIFVAKLGWDWRRRGAGARARFVLHLHGVAAVCLLVGLFAPMLTVIAQREVAVLGRVVLQFESKSIVGTVLGLYTNGNTMVALLLFLFSMVIPVTKLGVSLLSMLAGNPRTRDACIGFVRAVGKWSMTDVFVVAVLLAFLATGNGELTDARLGPGLYFFATYGLLSLTAGLLLARRKATPEAEARPAIERR